MVTKNSHYYFTTYIVFPEMFTSAISSSSNFLSVDFVNRFISSISLMKSIWNKTKLCVQSSTWFTVLLGVGVWADVSPGGA